MQQPNHEYTKELEVLIKQVLIPGYLKLCDKYCEPFPWKEVPAHLLVDLNAKPTKVAKLLQAAFRI
jgi:hypothetical protein